MSSLKKEIPEKLLDNKVEVLRKKPNGKKFLRINKKKIRKIFPNLCEEIINKVKKIRIDEIEKGINIELEVKNKFIKLNKDYYSIFEVYNEFRTVRENEYYKLLVRK